MRLLRDQHHHLDNNVPRWYTNETYLEVRGMDYNLALHDVGLTGI
jgi:hypothetical protein